MVSDIFSVSTKVISFFSFKFRRKKKKVSNSIPKNKNRDLEITNLPQKLSGDNKFLGKA